METKHSLDESKSPSGNIGKYLISIFIAGTPFVFCGLLTLMNPNYVKVFVSTDKGTQPLGWVLTATILLLTIMVYLGTGIAIDSLTNKQSRSIVWLVTSIMGVLVSVLVEVVLIFFGPALLMFLAAKI